MAPLLASGVRGKQGRSARRDQQTVKLEGLSPAEQVDLFLPECDESVSWLRGLPELAGDAHAEGIARVVGLPDDRCQRRHIGGGKGDHESVKGGSRLVPVGGDRGDGSGSDRYRPSDRKVARYAHRRRGRRGRRGRGGRGGRAPGAYLHGAWPSSPWAPTPRGPPDPAGPRPVAAGGWLRMTCTMIGDPRSRAGGRLTGAGPGPSGVMWLQPATASMRPTAASAR